MRKYASKKSDSRPTAAQAAVKDAAANPGVPMSSMRSMLMQKAMNDRSHRIDLPEAMRAKMEAAFGMNFGKVNLYESESVADAGANAIAQGGSIAFAPGKADFNSLEGQRRLGHEFSHIAAQARGEVAGSGFLDNGALEARADREGALAAAGEQAYSGPVMDAPSFAGASAPMQAQPPKEGEYDINGRRVRAQEEEDPEPEVRPKKGQTVPVEPTLGKRPDKFDELPMEEQLKRYSEETKYEEAHETWKQEHAQYMKKYGPWLEWKKRQEAKEKKKKEQAAKKEEEKKKKKAQEAAEQKQWDKQKEAEKKKKEAESQKRIEEGHKKAGDISAKGVMGQTYKHLEGNANYGQKKSDMQNLRTDNKRQAKRAKDKILSDNQSKVSIGQSNKQFAKQSAEEDKEYKLSKVIAKKEDDKKTVQSQLKANNDRDLFKKQLKADSISKQDEERKEKSDANQWDIYEAGRQNRSDNQTALIESQLLMNEMAETSGKVRGFKEASEPFAKDLNKKMEYQKDQIKIPLKYKKTKNG